MMPFKDVTFNLQSQTTKEDAAHKECIFIFQFTASLTLFRDLPVATFCRLH